MAAVAWACSITALTALNLEGLLGVSKVDLVFRDAVIDELRPIIEGEAIDVFSPGGSLVGWVADSSLPIRSITTQPTRLWRTRETILMAGTLDDNLRRGSLHETMGHHLLRGFAAVAPFPREQDYGIDFVATLLKRELARSLAADRTIAVQTKSVSERSITYDGAAARWLRDLDLPFFIGSVDTDNNSMALYSTHQFHRVYVEGAYETYRLDLDPVPEEIEHKNFRSVNLGRAPFSSIQRRPKFRDRGFLDGLATLSSSLSSTRNTGTLKTRRFGHIQGWRWETNEIPIHHSNSYSSNPRETGQVEELYRSIMPQLNMIASKYASSGDRAAWEILKAFQGLMLRDGFHPDPDGLMSMHQLFFVGTSEEWDTLFPKLKGAVRQRESWGKGILPGGQATDGYGCDISQPQDEPPTI